MKPNSIEDLDLFEAVSGKSFDDAELEDIESVVDKAHETYKELLNVTDSDELTVNIKPYKEMDTFSFSFTKNGKEFDVYIKPVMDLLFGSSTEVSEFLPNHFIIPSTPFSTSDSLEEWLSTNTPFKVNEVVEEEVEYKEEYTKSSVVNINGTEVTLHELSEHEVLRRKWESFANKFKEENRVLITVRNDKFHSMVTMKLMFMFGNYEQGKWDIFSTAGNRTITNQIQDKLDANDPSPVTYIIGIDDSVSGDKVKKFQRAVNKLKLTK